MGRDSQVGGGSRQAISRFNPRAPRGARQLLRSRGPRELLFQSTRPAWGATPCHVKQYQFVSVSIHAPRVGRDLVPSTIARNTMCFNPRAPRGARRGAPAFAFSDCNVSIHAPRVGRDARILSTASLALRFNPRAPRGARRISLYLDNRPIRVSIHAPRVGRDNSRLTTELARRVSIHAPRVGRDPPCSAITGT